MRYTNSDKIQIINEITSIINEGDSSASTDAERVIEILINLQKLSKPALVRKLNDSSDIESKFLTSYYKAFLSQKNRDMIDVYHGAITQIRNFGIHPSALNVGNQAYPTTKIWRDYGGITASKSKSDVTTKTKTFSVKNASTQVRVLDAAIPQVTALINYTVDTIGVSDQIQKVVKTGLNKMKKLQSEDGYSISTKNLSSKNMTQLRKDASTKTKKLIDQFDANSKEMNVALSKIFNALNTSPKFKTIFITESLSGRAMFGGKSEARADAIITFTKDFGKVDVHSIPTVTKAVINSFNMPKIATKTAGGGNISKTVQAYYTAGKSVREIVESHMEELRLLEMKESDLFVSKSNGLLTEGVFSDLWNTLKAKGIAIIEKMIQAIGMWIDRAIQFASKSWRDAINVIGVELHFEVTDEFAQITYGGIR